MAKSLIQRIITDSMYLHMYFRIHILVEVIIIALFTFVLTSDEPELEFSGSSGAEL